MGIKEEKLIKEPLQSFDEFAEAEAAKLEKLSADAAQEARARLCLKSLCDFAMQVGSHREIAAIEMIEVASFIDHLKGQLAAKDAEIAELKRKLNHESVVSAMRARERDAAEQQLAKITSERDYLRGKVEGLTGAVPVDEGGKADGK